VKPGIRNTLLGTLGFIAVIMGVFLYTMLTPHTLSDDAYKKLGYFPFHPPRRIGDFSLVDQQGQPAGHAELEGQWSLLYFGYTACPDVCPTTLAQLSQTMKFLTRRPQVIMVSVDPERDTPAKMAAYLRAFDPHFIGYTGTFDNVVNLAKQVNIAFGKVPGSTPGSYEVNHSADIVVVNPAGEYAGFIRPSPQPHNLAKVLSNLMGAPLKH